jgi:Uma2 family endonuclease
MDAAPLFTVAQLLALPTGGGGRCELLAGVLRVMPAYDWQRGEVGGQVLGLVASYVADGDLGMTFAAGTGFRLARNPDTVRAPDIAFIAKRNLPEQMPSEAFWPGAPDLAVEVLSPDDRTGEVNEKIETWLAAGTSIVWIVDPKLPTVTIYQRAASAKIYSSGDMLVGDPVVPGFSCAVDEIFG